MTDRTLAFRHRAMARAADLRRAALIEIIA